MFPRDADASGLSRVAKSWLQNQERRKHSNASPWNYPLRVAFAQNRRLAIYFKAFERRITSLLYELMNSYHKPFTEGTTEPHKSKHFTCRPPPTPESRDCVLLILFPLILSIYLLNKYRLNEWMIFKGSPSSTARIIIYLRKNGGNFPKCELSFPQIEVYKVEQTRMLSSLRADERREQNT